MRERTCADAREDVRRCERVSTMSIAGEPGNPAHPERDADWDENARGESLAERLDRNWGDLIQELRVVQTGVQFLTGFLLTLPFQQRFTQLTGLQRALYLATVSASIVSTAFLQTPVSVHRALFRRHQRQRAVLVAHRVAMIGIVFLAAAILGVTALIFDVVSGTLAAAIAAAAIAIVLSLLWLALPLALRGAAEGPAPPRRS
jgi:Family of unknown function (DUF6328)